MQAVYGVIVHSTRSGRAGNPDEYEGTIRYCLTPGTVSYHYLINYDGEICQLVQPDRVAFHAEEMNPYWLGVALCQPTIDDPITDEQHASLGWLLRKLCAEWGIPRGWPIWVSSPTDQKGIVEHRHTSQGARHGKGDVGPQLRWEKVRLW